MIWSLSVYFVATKILVVTSAPKLRYILFDPLTYEAKAGLFSARKDSSALENPTTNTPADHDKANFILSDDSSTEFLENDTNDTEQIENKTSATPTIVPTTTQTTTKQIEAAAPVLRSKSCFSCIGSLRTGETGSIPLKSLPIYLRANENQKGYPKFGYEFDDEVCKLVGKRILCGYNKNPGTIPNSKEIVHVDAECRIRGDRIECGYGNTDGSSGNGGGGKRALKLQMPTDETEITFRLKDIFQGETKTNQTKETEFFIVKNSSELEETKSTSVKEESVTDDDTKSRIRPSVVIQHADLKEHSTKAETISNEPTASAVSTTTTTVTTPMTDTTKESETTTENDTKTSNTEIEKEISSKIPFLSLRSIMKMSEDLEKMVRQGSESETTEYVQAVTRCVEIGDRIVCYNYKPRPTAPATTPSTSTVTTPVPT